MKDHEIAMTVNTLRGIAIDYGRTQQLRCRISGFITPILQKERNNLKAAVGALKNLYDALPHPLAWPNEHMRAVREAREFIAKIKENRNEKA